MTFGLCRVVDSFSSNTQMAETALHGLQFQLKYTIVLDYGPSLVTPVNMYHYVYLSVGFSEHGMLLLLLAGTVDHQSSVWGAESH